jgi:3,4-dihydroxy 2-butanone 4-phosphate synthase/GTP cyclohydrolase II
VICEIIRDDGEMARLPDLVAFAQHHGLKLGTIADLIAHRRRTERLVRRVADSTIQHAVGGEWHVVVFANTVDYSEHLVLVKGDISAPSCGHNGPPLVRMHAVDLMDDIVGGATTNRLHASMRMIAAEGRGAVVMLRDTRSTGLSQRVGRLAEPDAHPRELRDYGIGAQILLELGVTEMVLLSNTHRTIIGIEGYGLTVAGQKAIQE